MTNIIDKEVLALPDGKADIFHSTRAISWSYDNKAVLCCAEKLVIVGMVANPHLNSKSEAFMTTVEETPNVTTLSKFSVTKGLLNVQDTLRNLDEDERQILMADPSLTEEFIYPNEMLHCFKSAVCSPLCHLYRAQNLIAGVTYDHRTLIFAEGSQGWEVVTDCSAILRDQTVCKVKLPLTVGGQDMSLNRYKELVFSMCIVELEWSTVFFFDGQVSFQFLFTGTRGGDVHMWRASLPYKNQDDLTYQCTDHFSAEVTALSWLPRQDHAGLLAVGYINGSVRLLEASVLCDQITPHVTCVFEDLLAENLSISGLAWTQCHLDQNLMILIACKQYYLSLYSVHDQSVKHMQDIRVNTGLPLTGISMYGVYGVVSAVEGSLYSFQCKAESEQISVELSTMTLTASTLSSDMQWSCFGAALSPTSGLCLTAHRLINNYKLPEIRMKTMCRQLVVVSCPFRLNTDSFHLVDGGKDQPVSPQHYMISLRFHVQQMLQSTSNLQDIQIFQGFRNRGDICSLQIARDILNYIKLWSAIRTEDQKQLEWIDLPLAEISQQILLCHVDSCLKQVPTAPTPDDLPVLKSMLNWITSNKAEQASTLRAKFDLIRLKQLCEGSSVPPCAICGAELRVVSLLMAHCDKGHKIKLCSISFLPCQDLSMRRCEACQHPALSLSALSGKPGADSLKVDRPQIPLPSF